MKLLGHDIAPLGMGCWPIGGPFYDGTKPLGYANVEDRESIRTIHAAFDAGIRLFDTAAVYGAGHSERLLGESLSNRPDALIVTKIGSGFDETTKQLTAEENHREQVMPAIERCLKRLSRDRIDLLILHQNSLPVAEAVPLFDELEKACEQGKIRSYGWSTDFPRRLEAMSNRSNFAAVEHAMNVFADAPTIQTVAARAKITALIRSPLAMGILGGKYSGGAKVQSNDIRATNEERRDYFRNGEANQIYLMKLNAIEELLQSGGRSLAQGALCWLMAKSEWNIPIPGARTVEQVLDNAGAIAHGKLPEDTMSEIETLIEREPEGAAQAR